MRLVRQRVKHIIWELAESGVVGIHPPIIPVIGRLYILIIVLISNLSMQIINLPAG